MDEMESLDYERWHFLCSGEQLPSGQFHAVVRCKVLPEGQIRTLVLDPEKHGTANQAVNRAKELAMKWASNQGEEGEDV